LVAAATLQAQLDADHEGLADRGAEAVAAEMAADLFEVLHGGTPARTCGYPSAMAPDDPAQRILAAVRAIPRGQVAGYGEVARRAGLPGRARWVARLLAGNDDPALPWHRVLRSDGRIAFAPDSDAWREQARRLRAEGVDVVAGRVRIARAARSLDREVWGPG